MRLTSSTGANPGDTLWMRELDHDLVIAHAVDRAMHTVELSHGLPILSQGREFVANHAHQPMFATLRQAQEFHVRAFLVAGTEGTAWVIRRHGLRVRPMRPIDEFLGTPGALRGDDDPLLRRHVLTKFRHDDTLSTPGLRTAQLTWPSNRSAGDDE